MKINKYNLVFTDSLNIPKTRHKTLKPDEIADLLIDLGPLETSPIGDLPFTYKTN